MTQALDGISFQPLDSSFLVAMRQAWGEKAGRHLHFQDGITIAAIFSGGPIGLISAYTRILPPPLTGLHESYIDFLELEHTFGRRGIAARLVEMVPEHARSLGHYQVRSWSSDDKVEAIPMWRHPGFGLNPAVTHPQGKGARGYFVTKLV